MGEKTKTGVIGKVTLGELVTASEFEFLTKARKKCVDEGMGGVGVFETDDTDEDNFFSKCEAIKDYLRCIIKDKEHEIVLLKDKVNFVEKIKNKALGKEDK